MGESTRLPSHPRAKCSRCNEEKPSTDFPIVKSTGRLSSWCSACKLAHNKDSYRDKTSSYRASRYERVSAPLREARKLAEYWRTVAEENGAYSIDPFPWEGE